MLILLPLLGVLFNGLTTAHVEANLSLEFKATKLLRQHNPANCTVGNTTYAHGQTFKLDCKTQCVCENGRHACSSLCPKEQLPAPEDTISCRSPRLVEVPGHCCKMWLCENPTADVYATCHNASTSPWTSCSQPCGLGISTRFTSTNAGCRQLSSLRLCENRKCDQDNKNNNPNNRNYLLQPQEAQLVAEKATALQQQKQQLISHNVANNLVVSEPKDFKDITNYHALFQAKEHEEHRIRKGHECRSLQRLGPARIRLGACISRKLYRPKLCGRCHQQSGKCCKPSVSTTIQVELLCPLNADDPIAFAEHKTQQQQEPAVQAPSLHQLWDTVSLEPIDQEYLQSHQIQIENKFIAVEWILKCECSKYENCNNQQHIYATTTTMDNTTKPSNDGSNVSRNSEQQSRNNKNTNNNNSNHMNTINSDYNNKNGSINNGKNTVSSSWRPSAITVVDRKNNKNAATNIIGATTRNNNNNGGDAYDNNNSYNDKYNSKKSENNYAINNLDISGNGNGNNKRNMANSNRNNNNNSNNNHNGPDIATTNANDNRYEQEQRLQASNEEESENEWTGQQQQQLQEQQQEHLLSSSELQPDIIPYPAMLPLHRSAGSMGKQWEKMRKSEKSGDYNNNNNNNSNKSNNSYMAEIDNKRANIERHNNNISVNNNSNNNNETDINNNNNAINVESVATTDENTVVAGFDFYTRDVDETLVDDVDLGSDSGRVERVKQIEGSKELQQQSALETMVQPAENVQQVWQGQQQQQQYADQQQQLPEWQVASNLHYLPYHQENKQHHQQQSQHHAYHHHQQHHHHQQQQLQHHHLHHHHHQHQHHAQHSQHHQTPPKAQLPQLLWSDQLDQERQQQQSEQHTPHQRRT